MGQEKEGIPESPAELQTGIVDDEQIARVTELLKSFSQAVTVVRIYPSEHELTKKFADDFADRILKFLERYDELELVIDEFCFTIHGEKVLIEEQSGKSLSFFFYKDGMQTLSFDRGLDREEVKAFLEVIRKESLLPPEEGDIVMALWEKDFPFIRFYAPDEFLESRIGAKKEYTEIRIDKNDLFSGRIELHPEDGETIETSPLPQPPSAAGGSGQEKEGLLALEKEGESLASLDEREQSEIDSLLSTSRHISPEEEYINIVMEILYLEEEPEQLKATLDVLEQQHLDFVRKGDFVSARQLLSSAEDLAKSSFDNQPKASLFERFLDRTREEEILKEVQKVVFLNAALDPAALFEYLQAFGLKAVSSVAAMMEARRDPLFREAANRFLKIIAGQDLSVLFVAAHDSTPIFTTDLLSFVRQTLDKKSLPQLAKFVASGNSDLKSEVIRTLGDFVDETANKILVGFLSDPAEAIRIQAASSLNVKEDRTSLLYLLSFVAKKDFIKKNPAEKRALLSSLEKSGSEEAFDFLKKLIKTSGLMAGRHRMETRLLAVEALAAADSPGAKKILEEGTRMRSRKIRDSCLEGLKKIPDSAPSQRGKQDG